MMKDLSKIDTKNCTYCGNPLESPYYFCTKCAKPYRTVDSLNAPLEKVGTLSDQELIQEKAPQVWRIFWAYLSAILIAGVISLLLSAGDVESSMTLVSLTIGEILFIGITLYYCLRYRDHIVPMLKKVSFKPGSLIIGIAMLSGLLVLNFLLYFMLMHLLPEDLIGESPLEQLPIWGQILYVCIFAGVVEEIAFRGFILKWFEDSLNFKKALFISSLLFAALHLNPLNAPYLMLFGVALGWIRKKSENLYIPMVLHMLHNAAVLFLFPILYQLGDV